MRALIRWVFALTLIVTTLATGQGIIQCTTASEDAAISSNDDLPECCREGLCPHHAHQEAAKARAAAKSENDDCICRMSSRDSQTFLISAPTVADVASVETRTIDLSLLGSVSNSGILLVVPPDLLLWTPPPRA